MENEANVPEEHYFTVKPNKVIEKQMNFRILKSYNGANIDWVVQELNGEDIYVSTGVKFNGHSFLDVERSVRNSYGEGINGFPKTVKL